MSTAQTSDQSASPLLFAVPYLLGVVVQLPLFVRYISDLAARPHFGLYMIGMLATVAIAAVQWPWGQQNIHRATIKSVLFAVCAVAAGVAGAVLGQPWFTACSVILLIASYLAATVHRDGIHSVGYAVLPLLAFVRPPLNFDLGINARLQEHSMELASRFMTIAGASLIHVRTSSAFEFLGKDPFLHVDSLVGIGSVFSLIFVALVYVAINRRCLFQTALLILSCLLWAVLLNTAYLMLLPVLNYFLEIEVAAGSVNHNMIRVLLLLGTSLLIVSTGEFFNFAFSPVDPEVGRSYEFGRFITAVWNSLLAGRPFVSETGQTVGQVAAEITDQPAAMPLRWGVAGLLLAASVLPLFSAGAFESVSRNDVVTLSSDDMPDSIDDWASVEPKFQVHSLPGFDLQGFEKETWVYQSPDLTAEGSIAEPFNIWADLPRVYRLQHWKTKQRSVITPADASDPWQYVAADMVHETAENQRILFCYFDAAGQPVTPPASGSLAGQLSSARSKAQAPLFQIAVTHSHYLAMTPETDAALTDFFLKFRQAARDRILRGSTGANSASDPDATQSELPTADTQPSETDFQP